MDKRKFICDVIRRLIYVRGINFHFTQSGHKPSQFMYNNSKKILSAILTEIEDVLKMVYFSKYDNDFINHWNSYVIFKKYVTGVMINKCIELYEKNYEKQTAS